MYVNGCWYFSQFSYIVNINPYPLTEIAFMIWKTCTVQVDDLLNTSGSFSTDF